MSKLSWDRMKPKALASLRNDRLRRQFKYQLYAFSPYYHEKLDDLNLGPDGVSGVGDLARAPIVSRETLAAAPRRFFLRPTRSLIQKYGATGQLLSVSVEMIVHGSERSEQLVRSEYEPVHQIMTAGTQGEPIILNLSKRDLATVAVTGQRMLEVAGVSPSDKVLNLLPSQNSGGFWPLWLGGVSMGLEQSTPGPVDPGDAHDLLLAGRPSVVIGEAAFLLAVLRARYGVPSELKTVILAPRLTPASLRQQIERAVGSGVKVLATYGFAEGRSVWVECAEGGAAGGFHTYPDLEVFEVVSPGTTSPRSLQEGGELLFTGLEQRGTALARYSPGDIVASIQPGPCPFCGRNVDRIMGPITRVGKLVTVHAAGGQPIEIDEEVLEGALAHPDLAGWQLEVTKMPGQSNGYDDLCLLFQPREDKDPATLAVELDGILRRKLGLSPQMVLSERIGGGLVDLR